MLSPLRNRFGIPGVISVIALVFAMLGGAYAASGGASASKRAHKKGGLTGAQKKLIKKEAKKWGKKFAKTGPAGPAGPAGPQGPAGANGSDGANGTNGTNGADGAKGATGADGANGEDGKSVVVGEFEGAKGTCASGGVEVEVEGSGEVKYVCNGEDGEGGEGGGGLSGTLAGVWSGDAQDFVHVSYLQEINPAPQLVYPFFGYEVPAYAVINTETGMASAFGFEESEFEALCPGSVASPQATSGYLCIYPEDESAPPIGLIEALEDEVVEYQSPAPKFGAVFRAYGEEEGGEAKGSWAVSTE